jgi:hypothetical protein
MARTCNHCGQTKDESEFYSVKQRDVTRLRAICKLCSRAQLHDRTGEPRPAGRVESAIFCTLIAAC